MMSSKHPGSLEALRDRKDAQTVGIKQPNTHNCSNILAPQFNAFQEDKSKIEPAILVIHFPIPLRLHGSSSETETHRFFCLQRIHTAHKDPAQVAQSPADHHRQAPGQCANHSGAPLKRTEPQSAHKRFVDGNTGPNSIQALEGLG